MKLKVFTCLLLITLTCQALPLHAIIASIKALGMADTGVAYPQDALAAAFNPAGMAEIGNRLDLGAFVISSHGQAKIKNNPIPLFDGTFKSNRVKNFYGAEAGANTVLWRYGCDSSISFGVSIYNKSFLKTAYSRPIPIFGTKRAGLEYINEDIASTLSWKINSVHSIGISLDCMVQRFKLNGLQNLDNPFQTVAPGHVTNRGYDYSTGFGFTIGWLGHLHRCLTVGISYQPKIHMGRLHKYKGFIADYGRFDIPQSAAIGLTLRPLCGLAITFDVRWIEWRDNRALRNKLTIFEPLGSKNGTGFNWRNEVIYALGFVYELNDEWVFRAGYRHSRTPVKRSATLTNILTLNTVQDYLTFGATWSPLPCHEFSIFAAHGFNHGVKGRHSIPATLLGGEADVKDWQNLFGIGWGWMY